MGQKLLDGERRLEFGMTVVGMICKHISPRR